MPKRLPVPHRRQIADGFCLPACVEMVLAYLGVDATQEQLARQMGTVLKGGTPGMRVRVLASSDLEVTYAHGELSDLQAALTAGSPPIVLVRY